jgi:uncharacterized protein (UPF0332 family)
MSEDMRRLIDYRLDQAQETLDAARELSASGHGRDAINRAYYAMFYCGLALLASRGLGASKHSGVLSLFSKYFIKTGAFPVDYGRYLREAFELRQGADYREFVQITQEQVQEAIAHADAFLQHTRHVLSDWQE